jgi:bacillithiol biosynthesis cysteine-adding enzyme BshC
MSDDLFDHTPFKLTTETNKQLEAQGFHPQVNPREINFFYLEKNLRSRLEQLGDGFAVVDTELKFSREEISKKIKEEPEVFSPNVILRPLYQEMILPNLAYVGGPAELVYWLELKKVFEHHQVPFPMLLPRNFALIVDGPTSRKLSKTRLHLEAFFEAKDDLYTRWLTQHSKHNLSLDETSKQLEQLLADVQARCANIDATLSPMAAAQATKMKKMIQTIELKMVRAEKRKQSDSLRQIEAVKDVLFPNGSLQERTDNFLNFYQQDTAFIQKLLEQFDPFDFQFNVLSYHDQKGTSETIS